MVSWYLLYFLLQRVVALCCCNFTCTHLRHIKMRNRSVSLWWIIFGENNTGEVLDYSQIKITQPVSLADQRCKPHQWNEVITCNWSHNCIPWRNIWGAIHVLSSTLLNTSHDKQQYSKGLLINSCAPFSIREGISHVCVKPLNTGNVCHVSGDA